MCNKCQENNCGCSKKTVEYRICGECAPQTPCDCAVKDLSTNCSIFTGDDLSCSGIKKGTILTDLIVQLDAYICTAINQLNASLNLINIGTGAQIYKGIDGLGRRQLRTIVGSDSIIVTEEANTITLDVDLSGLDTPPLQKIDQGNGIGIIIRGRDPLNYLEVGNGAVDLSYSSNAVPTTGANGTHAFTANSKTIASAEDSAAFNNAEAGEQGSFAINESLSTGFYAFSYGSGQAKGQYSMAGGVLCEAEDQGSVATGTSTKALGFSSHAIGQETEASGDISSTAGFRTKTTGNSSHAGGNSNEANSHAEFSIGAFGTIVSGNPLAEVFVPTDRLFNIGNGNITPLTAIITRSDALTLLKNGLLTLPSVTNALITAASGKAVVTKEYLNSVVNGSETKINAGTNVTVTGNGTIATPYIINSSSDGSETKVNAGTNISVTGNGTTATPYVINNTLTVDGSETKLSSGTTTVVTGNGTIATPYKVETVNLQKAITANYTLLATDNNYSIKVNNGATPITITVPSGLPENFFVGITQKGTADVTFVGSGTTITNPVGLKIKGQGYCVGLEQIGSTNSFDLLADTKA